MSLPIICLMGPTASGKTALACQLAQHFPCEIISVDSALIYRGMNIGTAKPDDQILAQAPHHLIDIMDPPDSYSAAQFCADAMGHCQRIHAQGKIPLLVGGTMMYFRALQQGLSALPAADERLRLQLSEQAKQHGWDHMHQWLSQIDAETAARVHPHDSQRIQRALEVYQLTGQPMSVYLKQQNQGNIEGSFLNIILFPEDRAWLHARIALRFVDMLKQGFIDEVQQLLSQWHLTEMHPSMRAVGYRQIMEYLQGKFDHNLVADKGIAATRQLAKRQLTWLRQWPNGHFFAAENPRCYPQIIALIHQMLDNEGFKNENEHA